MRIFSILSVISLAFFATTARADMFTGGGFALVDASGATAGTAFGNIVVAGNGGTVASIDSVTISGFTHTFIGDIFVDFRNVTNATAITVRLAGPPDATEANFNGTYTFSVNPALQTIDEAVSGLGDADVAPGAYAIAGYGGGTANGTRTNFNTMSNLAIDGTWQLRVVDFGAGDTGAITGWSFNATITAVPEPSSIALLGGVIIAGGSLGIRRKRMLKQSLAKTDLV